MSASNQGGDDGSHKESEVSHQSPVKVAPRPSLPNAPRVGASKTEMPMEPYNPYQPYRFPEADTPIGNPKALTSLRLEGQLGVFYDRENTTRIPTLVEFNFLNFRTAARLTIGQVLLEALEVSMAHSTETVDNLVEKYSADLANGVAVMLYSKLRMVNYFDLRVADRFRKRPKVPAPFEVPQPYALAISQIGAIKISGRPQEIYLSPSAPAQIDETFGCSPGHTWTPAVYARAVEFAKKLGLRFSPVDLTVKMGSSWWLYRPVAVNNTVTLECPYPEENFTETTATLATLFCINEVGEVYNPIIDIALLGTRNYGSMARELPADISYNTFCAVIEKSDVDYKVVN